MSNPTWEGLFNVLADLPRQFRERERSQWGKCSQEPDPNWHDNISCQAAMDREWAESMMEKMGWEKKT